MKSKAKNSTTTPEERHFVNRAERLGLYIYFDGPVGARKRWIIYSRATGKALGYWNPNSGAYDLNDLSDVCKDPRKVLLIASGKHIAANESSPRQSISSKPA